MDYKRFGLGTGIGVLLMWLWKRWKGQALTSAATKWQQYVEQGSLSPDSFAKAMSLVAEGTPIPEVAAWVESLIGGGESGAGAGTRWSAPAEPVPVDVTIPTGATTDASPGPTATMECYSDADCVAKYGLGFRCIDGRCAPPAPPEEEPPVDNAATNPIVSQQDTAISGIRRAGGRRDGRMSAID